MQKNTGLVFNCYNVRRKLVRSARVKKVKMILTKRNNWIFHVMNQLYIVDVGEK